MTLLEKSLEITQWINTNLNGVKVSSDGKTCIVSGCHSVVIENQKAIILLLQHNVYSSAFSLVRIQFEAYVRALWLNYCATNSELEDFKKEKLTKKFYEIIEEIEKVDGYKSGVLSKAKKAGWAKMNSFTHTGFTQVVRQLSEDYIEQNYDKGEIEEVFNFANALGLLSLLEIAFLSKDNALITKVSNKIKEI